MSDPGKSQEPDGSAYGDDAGAMDECHIVRSNKGGAKLVHDGYIYTVHKHRQGCVRWRCSRRSVHCKGSVTTTRISAKCKVRALASHNHDPDKHAARMTILHGVQGDIRPKENQYTAMTDELSDYGELDGDKDGACDDGFADPNDDDTTWLPSKYNITTLKVPPAKSSKRILEKKQKQPQAPSSEYLTPINATSLKKVKLASVDTPGMLKVVKREKPPVDDEVCLRWNSHYNNMQAAFPFLLAREQFVDVTLCCEGQLIRCHRIVLSSCSTYFDEIISGLAPFQHPVIHLSGISFWVVRALIDFMYVGEVNIEQSKVQTILKVGEDLKIKGLTKSVPSQCYPPPSTPPVLKTPAKVPSFTRFSSQESLPPVLPIQVPLKQSHIVNSSIPRNSRSVLKCSQAHAMPIITSVVSSAPILQKEAIQTQPPVQKTANDDLIDDVKQVKKEPVKKAIKRRISDCSENENKIDTPPLPEHLLFVRKGTRSRPLVKTPKMYQLSVSPEREKVDHHFNREKPSSAPSNRDTPSTTRTSVPDKKILIKLPAPISAPASSAQEEFITTLQIKTEPLDIDEHDNADTVDGIFANEALLFDDLGQADEDDGDDDDELIVDNNDDQSFIQVINPGYNLLPPTEGGKTDVEMYDNFGGLDMTANNPEGVEDKKKETSAKSTAKAETD